MSKKILTLLLTVCFLSYTAYCQSQPGDIDFSFTTGTGADSLIQTCAIQPDGKIIIGGRFTSYNGTAINRIARLNADGTLDNSFNSLGTGANSYIETCAIQPDGKIIIGGWFTSYNGTAVNRITRLNTDGSLDNSFNSVGAGANDVVLTCTLQSDDKIIIGGYFTTYNGNARRGIARLNADGTLDTGFNPGTGASSDVNTCAMQSDGKIIIGGIFSTYNGTARNFIARVNADGTLDFSFDPGTGVGNGSVETCAIQSDGKIIIGGTFSSYNGTTIIRIARLNSDGSLDTGFDPGTGPNSDIYTCRIQSDGKIIIGGYFNFYNGTIINRITRLNADGSIDTDFNPTGSGTEDVVYTCAIQNDGKIIIGGNFTSYNGNIRKKIARINVACEATIFGNIDATISGVITDGTVYLIQTDTPDNLWDTIATGAITDGTYFINFIPAQHEYILLASPDTLFYSNTIPTYYGNIVFWDLATSFIPGCNESLTKDITVEETTPGTGNCDFTGTVFLTTCSTPPCKTLTTDPIPLIDVVVKKTPPGNAIAYTFTDNNGQFTFTGMEVSDSAYTFYINIPGLVMWGNYTLHVSLSDLIYQNLNFYVDTATGSTAGIYTMDPNGIEVIKKKTHGLFAYPNPFSNQCVFNFNNEKNTSFAFELFDFTGKLLRKENNLQGSSYLLKPEGLADGIYIAQITIDDVILRSRVVINRN